MTISTSSSAYSIPSGGGVNGGYNLRANTAAAQNAPPLGSGNFPNSIEKRVKLSSHSQADRSIISKAKDVLDQDDNLFFKLCDLERQIDEKIIKKQNEIAASSFRSNKLRRNLKIYVSNSFCEGNSNEGISSMSSSRSMEDIHDLTSEENSQNNQNACWILRIEGKVDQSSGNGQGLLSSSASSLKRSTVPNAVPNKFSHYLKSLVIEFENGELVEWNKMTTQSSLMNCDGFEMRRGVNSKFASQSNTGVVNVPTDEERVNCKIHLQFDFTPERFQLAPQLSKLLNLSLATKPAIVVALWQYIKLHKLQESDEKKIINNDAALQELFKVNRMSFSEIPMLVEPYLLPPEPVTISYQIIKGKQELNVIDEVFEIEIDVDDSKTGITNGSANAANSANNTNYYNTTNRTFLSATLFRDLNFYETRVKELIDALHVSKTNFNLLNSFALDPIKTAQKILKTATRDYETLIGDVPVTLEELSRAEFYESESVGEAVVDFLSLNPRFLQF